MIPSLARRPADLPAMRRSALGPILGVLLAAGWAPAAHAARGGPDTYGYSWRDGAEPGIVYAWEDISGGATDITMPVDDQNTGLMPLSFAFPYYGTTYAEVAACTNGWVSPVDGAAASFFNGPLPAPGGFPTGIIAGYWDDLNLAAGGTMLWQDLGDRAVFTFKNVPYLRDDLSANTFQIILHADGRIVVQYQDIYDVAPGSANSATLGIESPDEANGLTVFNNVRPPSLTNYVVQFDPPAPIPIALDCAGAGQLGCGDAGSGDLTLGVANQSAYRCTLTDYSGREQVWRADFATPTTARFILDTISGDPDLLVVSACDPNRCQSAAGDNVLLSNAVGTYYLVVDSVAGNEGAYRLRMECSPLPPDVDCASAQPLACDDNVAGDLALGAANQDSYWCSLTDYSGNEQVYVLDLPSPVNLLLTLTATSGNPDIVLIDACDPNDCVQPPGDTIGVQGAQGLYYVVVDSRPGDEGAYTLAVQCLGDSFTFCDGAALLEVDPWGDLNGSWLVVGWLYHIFDTHNFAMRVDGTVTYEHAPGACLPFDSVQTGAQPPNGPAFTRWTMPEGEVRMTMAETRASGCCGILVDIRVTNTDAVPHFYDFRVYHDTAFGDGAGGACGGGVVDGGFISVDGVRYDDEADLIALGADACPSQLHMYSADDDQLKATYEMLPPNTPTDMEFLDWNDGGFPCDDVDGDTLADWNNLVDGSLVPGCNDNSLLLIWRFPQGFGTLAPGGTGTARYRIGWQCAWPCGACEDPVLGGATPIDVGPCNDGIKLTWDPATFPGLGNGVYHVYRSEISFADALAGAPLTLPGGVTGTQYTDASTTANRTYYYVLQAESTDFPGCGTGPAVMGSTDTLDVGPITDSTDLTGPAGVVGNTLRATAHGTDTVDFNWLIAPAPVPGEQYAIFRSDDRPQGPFSRYEVTGAQAWTDRYAPPTYEPPHVWFYDVRIVDECGNRSSD